MAYSIQRAHDREPCEIKFEFTVLFMKNTDFGRVESAGKIIDASAAGIGMLTEFPLEPGYVVEWDDSHKKGRLHIALVRWARKLNGHYRAGLKFI